MRRSSHQQAAGISTIQEILEIIQSAWVAKAIGTFSHLRIADFMSRTPKHLEVIAVKSGLRPEPLGRLLRALAVSDVVIDHGEQRFSLSSKGELLKSKSDFSLRSYCAFFSEISWDSWGQLSQLMIFDARKGKFDDRMRPDSKEPDYHEAMDLITRLQLTSLMNSYDFSRYPIVADLGSGRGKLIRALIEQKIIKRGILFDRAHGLPKLEEISAKLRNHLTLVAGNFFQKFTLTADLFILKHILHDWSDEKAVQILKRIAPNLIQDRKLLVIESFLPEDSLQHFSKYLDLQMLVGMGGRERTIPEYRALFKAAGLCLENHVLTKIGLCVLEVGRDRKLK